MMSLMGTKGEGNTLQTTHPRAAGADRNQGEHRGKIQVAADAWISSRSLVCFH